MGIPFGTEMPTAVFVPSSIPNFPGACSLKAQAPKMPMIRVNPEHAFQRNRGMLLGETVLSKGGFYPDLAKVSKA